MVLDSKLRKAWTDMRQAGGSIISHKGENLTANARGELGFAKYLSELCASDPDRIQDAIDTINEAIRTGAWFADMNRQRFTSPKCHSKPIVTLGIGCNIRFHFDKRNGQEEEDCS